MFMTQNQQTNINFRHSNLFIDSFHKKHTSTIKQTTNFEIILITSKNKTEIKIYFHKLMHQL